MQIFFSIYSHPTLSLVSHPPSQPTVDQKQLFWICSRESENAGRRLHALFYAILHRELEHLWIWVLVKCLEPSSADTEGQLSLSLWGVKSYMQIFNGQRPNPQVVQKSTELLKIVCPFFKKLKHMIQPSHFQVFNPREIKS